MTHLILHKVRGEPAFDIAEQIQIGDERGWIIPTSGHRAYPFTHWELSTSGVPEIEDAYQITPIPADWPDHYNIDKGEAPKADFNIMSIITKMLPKVHRRM